MFIRRSNVSISISPFLQPLYTLLKLQAYLSYLTKFSLSKQLIYSSNRYFFFANATKKDFDKKEKVEKPIENNEELIQRLIKSKTFNLDKFNVIKKIIEAKKLKQYRDQFYQNSHDYSSVVPYITELNRQGKYEDVLAFISSNRIPIMFNADIKREYRYAEQRIQLKGNFYQQKPGLFISTIRFLAITYILYWLFKNIGVSSILNIDIEETPDDEEKKKDPMDTSSKIRPPGGGLFGDLMGTKNFATPIAEKNIKTRFADVLGIDEFKEELEEIVDFLKNPKKYTEVGAKIPKGILLIGPPGTGKTLMARALAGEAGCSFFYKSGSEFDEMFVGVGASRVRELFQKARKMAPSIIFIDEIDALAGQRREMDMSHTRDTVNQLLAEMDGFKPSDNVIVIGATNMGKALDPAVKRPGRFDKAIHVPLPDVKGREEIFNYYLKKIQYEPNVDPSILARQTTGFSGADIENMVNVAILNAVKEDRKKASRHDFEHAMDRITMGIGRKKMHISDKDKLVTAYHEGGHALVSLLTEGATPLHKLTILPRGGALGFTAMIPEKDQLNMTKRNILATIDVCMGGRAAEELFLGKDDLTTGCSNDLQKATDLAYQFVRVLGMHDERIFIATDKERLSEKFNYAVDLEAQSILKESLDRVKNLLKTNEDKLSTLAKELIARETMGVDEVKKLLKINKN